jgi:hypothetical protein
MIKNDPSRYLINTNKLTTRYISNRSFKNTSDRATSLRAHDQPVERLLRRSGKSGMQHVLRRLSRVPHRISHLRLHRDSLRKGLTSVRFENHTDCFIVDFQCLRKVSKFVASQNERVYLPRGLRITDPCTRGLRLIEISILDQPSNAT